MKFIGNLYISHSFLLKLIIFYLCLKQAFFNVVANALKLLDLPLFTIYSREINFNTFEK